MLSVESLIESYFPELEKRNRFIKKPVLSFFRYLFHESEMQRFDELNPHLSGIDFVEQVLEYFDFRYLLNDVDKEQIPQSGKLVVVANHPIGSLDGLALIKLVSEIRSDVKIVANEILSNLKPLKNLIIPVDVTSSQTSRFNIQSINRHLDNNGVVVFFPAGEVSRLKPQGVRDNKWNSGFLRIAMKYKAPILPIFIDGRNSILFYGLSMIYKPVSTLWLIREMFKHSDRDVRIRIGSAIEYDRYSKIPLGLKAKTALFKKHVYKLPKHKSAKFLARRVKGIALPEAKQALKTELQNAEFLGKISPTRHIYLYRFNGDSTLIREIARLREMSFRAVGEGTGRRRDMDRFDFKYEHLLLWDESALEIIGAYRLLNSESKSLEDLYSSTLFRFTSHSEHIVKQGLELGRSFIQPEYWNKGCLEYLWQGIGAYLLKYPNIRYLYGPVSISNSYPDEAKNLLVEFYTIYFPAAKDWAIGLNEIKPHSPANFSGEDYRGELKVLKTRLKEMDLSIPTLLKQYAEVCNEGGAEFVAFSIDSAFENCIDGMVCVDLAFLKADKRKRYIDIHRHDDQ